MPLTMQLFGDKANGHIMISGKEIIFAWRFYQSDENTKVAARNNRAQVRSLLSKHNPLLFLMLDTENNTYAETDDPRHSPLAHVSMYDHELCMHSHLTFKENLTFDILSLVFLPLLPHVHEVSDVFSKECLDYLLETSREYFLKLEASKEAQSVEAAFRMEKMEEFKMATIEAERMEKEAPKQTLPKSLATLLSDLKETTDTINLLNSVLKTDDPSKKKKKDKSVVISLDIDSLLSGLSIFPSASSSATTTTSTDHEKPENIFSFLKK